MKKQSNKAPPFGAVKPSPPPAPPSKPTNPPRTGRAPTGQHRQVGHSECGPDKYKAWVRVACKSVRVCKHNNRGTCNMKWITINDDGQCGMYEPDNQSEHNKDSNTR